MKRKISLILCFTMILNAFFININAVTDEKSNFQETTTEVSFENTSEISSELSAGGAASPEPSYELDKDDISDAGIDKVLEHEGLLGLSKKQYVQYLMKHYKNADFEEDQALMEYTGTTAEFTEKYIKENSKIIAIEKYSTENNYVVYFKGKSQNLVINMIRKLAKDDKVIHIQPNFRYYPCAIPSSYNYTNSLIRAYEQIEAPRAWDYATGSGVKVGIIDSLATNVTYNGVNTLSVNTSLSSNAGLHGTSKCSNSTCFYSHGTTVASVIAMKNVSQSPYVGLAYNCSVYSFNALQTDDTIKTSTLVDYIDTANSNGIKIINASMAPGGISNYFLNANELKAIKKFNGLYVQGAGNSAYNLNNCSDKNDFKDLPNYIVVGAVNDCDYITSYSNYGDQTVHIAAPGDLDLYELNEGVHSIGGTSFSAPLVTATAALMLQVNPSLTPAQLKTNILNAADTVPQLNGKIQGARRLNVKKAVAYSFYDVTKLRIASLSNSGTLQLKEGDINASWSTINTGVSDFQLEGKKIGIIQSGTLKIKEGASTAAWSTVDTNVKSFKMKGNTICVLKNTNELKIYNKSGSNYTLLKTISGVTNYDIEGKAIIYRTSSDAFAYYTEGNYSSSDSVGFADTMWFSGPLIQLISDGRFSLYKHTTSGIRSCLSQSPNNAFSSTFNRTILSGNNQATYLYQFTDDYSYNSTQIISSDKIVKAVKAYKYKMFYIGSNENVLYYQQGTPSATWSAIKWNVNSMLAADGYTGVITTDGTFSIIPDNGTWQVMSTNVKKAQILF